jgi:diaminopimelate decarboxylase
MLQKLKNLTENQVRDIAKVNDTPLFVYKTAKIDANAQELLSWEAPYGRTLRYAMKANPNKEVIKRIYSHGIGIDASSGYEAIVAMESGVDPEDIQITSQQIPHNFEELLELGVKFNACSLNQLEAYGKIMPGTMVGVRINPGNSGGEGLNNRLTTAGSATSFGIWHEYIDKVHDIVKRYDLIIDMVHTHAGSGGDPDKWLEVTKRNMEIVGQFPSATKTSIGGGFKVGRMPGEKTAKIADIAHPIAKLLSDFKAKTSREIHLEVEPGSFLTVNIGSLIAEIIDVKDTGTEGYNFILINAGMTEILRPSLYGAQHPLVVVGRENTSTNEVNYAVSGHCCESGDMLTVAAGDPETLEPRTLQHANIGDYLVVEDVGAYCASMRAISYNSFPAAKEILIP